MFIIRGYNENGCGTWLRFMQKNETVERLCSMRNRAPAGVSSPMSVQMLAKHLTWDGSNKTTITAT